MGLFVGDAIEMRIQVDPSHGFFGIQSWENRYDNSTFFGPARNPIDHS